MGNGRGCGGKPLQNGQKGAALWAVSLTGTPGWERRRRKKGGERQQFHEGPDLGRRRREPSSPEPRLPLSPTGTSVNGSGQELSTGRPLPRLLAGDSAGDRLPLRSASLDTRDAFSFPRTPQLSISPFPSPSPDVITPYDSLRA